MHPRTSLLPATRTPALTHDSLSSLIERSLDPVREDMIENPYIIEALRVLPVRGYRSAIGSIWNAVVDDLRNKIIHRSLPLFNKAIKLRREIARYEDFQNYVNDDELIEGAYEIGVIGWEAVKVLKHAKETRHIFDGHPHSSEPSPFKVLAMLDDCVRYVLSQPYPVEIVDIDDYLTTMQSADFDRSEVSIRNALVDLPAVYKTQLIHRLFSAYVHDGTPTNLRSNIELVAPILWSAIDKQLRVQVVQRVDKEISNGKTTCTQHAFEFVRRVGASAYLSATAKSYLISPIVEQLTNSLDQWAAENAAVSALEPYAAVIPSDLMPQYVAALTLTYVGKTGGSYRYARTNFYADIAALKIPGMFKMFDDDAAAAFVHTVRSNGTLRDRIQNEAKMDRLRMLAQIVLEKVSASFPDVELLRAIVAPERQQEFWTSTSKKQSIKSN